jgi:hypothetical protein
MRRYTMNRADEFLVQCHRQRAGGRLAPPLGPEEAAMLDALAK